MTDKPTVLYNGACPICRREIEHYRRLDRDHDEALDFTDIEGVNPKSAGLTLTDDQARRRLHVLDADGHLLVGIPAFAAIWERLPRYRWLAKISRLPVLRGILQLAYEPIAFCLYRWDKKRRGDRGSAKA